LSKPGGAAVSDPHTVRRLLNPTPFADQGGCLLQRFYKTLNVRLRNYKGLHVLVNIETESIPTLFRVAFGQKPSSFGARPVRTGPHAVATLKPVELCPLKLKGG